MSEGPQQPISLGHRFNVDDLRKRFVAHKRLQIHNFLAEDSALALCAELTNSADWRHIIKGGQQAFEIARDGFDALPASERAKLDAAIFAEAARSFRFRYDLIRVPDGRRDRSTVASLLAELASLLSQEAALKLFREITGDSEICFADAQATLYRCGDFLTRHDDDVQGKGRRLAYVLSLSPEWLPEWGGLLLFNEGRDGMIEAITPRFNALSLFSVPQPHSVSIIAPYAPAPRLSVTGWLRSGIPPA